MPVFTRFRRPPDTDAPAGDPSVSEQTADVVTEAAPKAESEPAPADRPSLRSRLDHWRSWRARYPSAARAVYWTTTAVAALLVFVALLLPPAVGALRTTGSPGCRERRSCWRPSCSRCRAARGSRWPC